VKILTIILFMPLFCFADLMDDFDSLGGNKALLEKAEALRPETKIMIVQKRVVNRHSRHEFFPEFEHTTSGGNPYFSSNALAVGYQFHVNPHWSLGVKYFYSFNKLTDEGNALINRAKLEADANQDKGEIDGDDQPFIPELNWPEQSYMAVINWYPIYGKMNLLDQGIVHFDIYTLLGGGQVTLRSNKSDIYQLGLGIGLWWSQYLTSRFEIKYQTYDAQYYDKSRKVENTTVSFAMGYML